LSEKLPSEFTGERLVPGEVDADLWNEHISRYAFAAQFCTIRTRVLDAGCGTGYGASFLAQSALSVLGIDSSPDAIGFANRQYGRTKARFAVGLCESLPLQNEAKDLIVAFEVIEHLEGWRLFLEECQRVLAPGGVLLVSTPNKSQYTESRGPAGPNPFHVHEFEFLEFTGELERIFSNVRVFGQNHAECIVFSTREPSSSSAQFAPGRPEPGQAGFFVAVCTKQSQSDPANFVYVPDAANVLHERERHIQLLAADLQALQADHALLMDAHRAQISELERSNTWAESLNLELQKRGARIVELQQEQDKANRWADALSRELKERAARVLALQDELLREQSQFRNELDRLTAELGQRTDWARGLDTALADRVAELARCVDLLHAAERTIHERTLWAQTAQNEANFSRNKVSALEAKVKAYELSRWVRIGKTLHVGPLAQ
jgi:SAM-dependent methyltransferase